MARPTYNLLSVLLLIVKSMVSSTSHDDPLVVAINRGSYFYRDLTQQLSDRQSRFGDVSKVADAVRSGFAWRVSNDVRMTLPMETVGLMADAKDGGGFALPRKLAVAMAFRPERENATLLAVRGPGMGIIQFGVSYSIGNLPNGAAEQRQIKMELWLETPDSASRLAVSKEKQLPRFVLRDVSTGFQMNTSWIEFYLFLDGNSLRYEFWCPGQQFWSGNPEYQQLTFLTSSGSHQLDFLPGSIAHLLSDGVANYFRGDISSFVLASPMSDHSKRQRLKCQRDAMRSPPAARGLAMPPSTDFEESSSGDSPPTTLHRQPTSRKPLPTVRSTMPTMPTPALSLFLPTVPDLDVEPTGSGYLEPNVYQPTDWLSPRTAKGSLLKSTAAPTLQVKGEKGDAGSPGAPGVCSEKCRVDARDQGLEVRPLPTALPGPVGPRGEPGPVGPKGQQGPMGPRGEPGSIGPRGEMGPTGPRGDKGTPGSKGEQGAAGQRGEVGPAGPRGGTGIEGPRGATGDPGPKGDMGDIGLKGREGNAGPPGETGASGSKGDQGTPGRAGDPGPPGPKGEPGRSVSVGSSGSQQTGAKGDKGDRGDRGNKGDIGDRGYHGDKGDKGDKGSSGDKGDNGDKGANGDKGNSGAQGPVGPSGPPGLDGAKGEPGDRGLPGMKAAAGAKGTKGEPGSGTCSCNAGPPAAPVAVASFGGARVFTTHQIFIEVSRTLEEGALAYVKDSNSMYLKTDFQKNTWIEMVASERHIQIAFPTPATTVRPTPPVPPLFSLQTVVGPKLRLVALPFKLYGDMSYKSAFSNLAADYACQEEAARASLGSGIYFRAFLNGQYNSLNTLVHPSQRSSVPVVNFYSQKLFDSFSDMLSRGVWNPEVQLQDFTGKNLSQWSEHQGAAEILSWRGLRHSDRSWAGRDDAPTPVSDCEGFVTRDFMKRGLVTDLRSGRLFQAGREITCDSRQVVLCIEAHDADAKLSETTDFGSYRRR